MKSTQQIFFLFVVQFEWNTHESDDDVHDDDDEEEEVDDGRTKKKINKK